MLKEIPRGNSEHQRRWFASEQADLYVWEKDDGIDSFEYCYRVRMHEFSLRWHHARGFEHVCVDHGEISPFKNNTPIAIAGITPDWGVVTRHFRREGIMIESELYRFILHKLYSAYCAQG